MFLICDIYVGRMWMYSKISCYYKIWGERVMWEKKYIFVVKIIVRYVECGIGNGWQMYVDKKLVNCILC